MESNIKGFLNQTSESQKIFQWDSIEKDYKIIRGNQRGFYVRDLYKEYPDETKEMLEDLYENENTNYSTKQILKEIVKINKIRK